MRIVSALLPAAVCALVSAVMPAAALARSGLDVAFGAEIAAGDDTQLFASIAGRYFDSEPATVTRLAVRWRDPDDLAVGLFIANRSGRPPERVFALRERGLSWWQAGVECGLPADVWFVPVAKEPGPPYGRAYGHWRKLREERVPFPGLDDDQARDLVAVRLLHEYYGVAPATAMSWRSGGRDVRALANGEYRRRHAGPGGESGKSRGAKESRDAGKPKGAAGAKGPKGSRGE